MKRSRQSAKLFLLPPTHRGGHNFHEGTYTVVRDVSYFAISVKDAGNDCQNCPKKTFLYKYTLS
jgi:hypothetical protein